MADNTIDAFNWQQAINETFSQFSQQVIAYAPQLLGALSLLAFGYVVAHVLSLSTKNLVQGLDALFKRLARIDGEQQARIRNSYALIASKIVFWVVLIFFIAVSTNVLGSMQPLSSSI